MDVNLIKNVIKYLEINNFLLKKVDLDVLVKNLKKEENIETKNNFKSEEMLEIYNRRYLGSKTKLIPFIKDIVTKYCGKYNSFFDVFGGTGIVAYSFNTPNVKIIINDFLKSNKLAYDTWLGTEKFNMDKIKNYITIFNNINPQTIEENYVSINFGNSFFSIDNAKKIGEIRERIEILFNENKINEREKSILITSLLYATDKVANTCGHYDAFRKKLDKSSKLILQIPKITNKNNIGNEIYNIDSNLLSKKIKADIAYIDPPYNSRQYGDAYHLLENISTWEKPEVVGIAKKMVNRSHIKSKYCTVGASFAFKDLIDNLDCKYILVSYNNMGEKGAGRSQAKISDKEIENILSEKGKVKIFEQDYKYFTTGKSEIEGHKERIFLCKVFKKKQKNISKGNTKIIKKDIVKSPLNYTGGKNKLIPQLKEYFPPKIDTFYDVFTGGANVGINIEAKNIICIDKEKILIELFNLIKKISFFDFESQVYSIINEYGLSLTSKYGYEYYGCSSDKGVASYNKEKYLKLRRDFNSRKERFGIKDKKVLFMFFVLIMYSFNNQIRFNKTQLNIPVGKRDFNNSLVKKLKLFKEKIDELNIKFEAKDFRNISLKNISKNSFFYFDPPYFLGTASYNENNGWTEKDEKDLYNFLDTLNEKGIKFALSNVLEHKGQTNNLLKEWAKKQNYKINYLNFNYKNSNYQKNKSIKSEETLEILITNYKIKRG